MDGITPVMDINNHGYGYGDGFGFGGGSGIWLFAILALMWGGNGLWGNRGAAERCATVEDINNAQNFARLESQVQGGFSEMSSRFTDISNGICSLGYDLASKFGTLETQIATCCCSMEKVALENRYLSAQNTAAINANTTAGIQKVLDKLCEQEKAALTARVNQLELDRALCGVIRYPNAVTYTAGYPFAQSGCACGGYGI